MSNFIHRVKLSGILQIKVIEVKSNKLLRRIIKRNTITFDAGDILRDLLAQRATDYSASQLKLGSMRFGTDGTVPTRSDTDLLGEITAARYQFQDVDKVNGISGELTVSATMGSGVGNGYTYQEAGLFTNGAVWNDNVGGSTKCYSRQVHSSIAKTSSLSLEYAWTLQFTV